MGGRGRRTQRRHFKDGRENVWKRPRSDAQQQDEFNAKKHWEPFATQNACFDDYYKEQGIVALEEWDTFNSFLRRPLPAAFRINSSSQFCNDIRSQLENDFMISLQAEDTDGNEVAAIKPLSWYPGNLAWQSTFSRMQLRKNQLLERFHEFLKLENEIGNITRQEAVSMVPPLFLDVRPDHFVLDMCAAPGSKTFQLLEMIYQSIEPGTLPSGMVIANDVDVQRCNLLIHQTKRMCTANLIVTNHEAQHFPSCRLKKSNTTKLETGGVKEHAIDQLLFDRVLCDVPCSGDGTLRKAPDIWRKWNVGMGNALHCLQVQIAMRGLSLLKVGGKMVYSTCSMNPVENEAVVAEILRKCGGSVELLDVSAELPHLIRRPGLKKWKVRDKGAWIASYKDVRKFRRQGIVPSMFPSGKQYIEESAISQETDLEVIPENDESTNGSHLMEDKTSLSNNCEEEISDLPLEYCMRIVPHDQDSGAFFVAVFQKLSPLPAFQKKTITSPEPLTSNDRSEKLEVVGNEEDNLTEISLTEVKEQSPEPFQDPDFADDKTGASTDTEANNISEETELEDIQAPVIQETVSEVARGKRKLQVQGKWRGVDPVVFLKSDTIINGIKTFYGIKESFPFSGHLVTRNSDTNHVKRIYYVSDSVKDVLKLNFLGGEQLKITSIGLKMFERQTSKEGDNPAMFRISSEGLPLLLPHITKQVISAKEVDFKHLLQYKTIKFADFVDAEFGEKASKLLLGCCVVVMNKGCEIVSDPPHVDASTIAVGCWRGRTNVAVMVTALDCQELLERLLPRTDKMDDSSPNGSKLPIVDDTTKENNVADDDEDIGAHA
ncbi:tRNA (Cytosine(34)-C(5))-methyltransferase [Heracleum sosnowskyi]|uniref:tRNA (Cytosine(34)-C(5))-methyltransferase n=1 Tax=Heracleum sosnowskyi TaxID=360622 RepID=A0AAD8HQW5_9APIA|nr:tRNA (Cytosine(34)-C(5))-methyltransferase [Heracleum sosnowskyi]